MLQLASSLTSFLLLFQSWIVGKYFEMVIFYYVFMFFLKSATVNKEKNATWNREDASNIAQSFCEVSIDSERGKQVRWISKNINYV